MKLFIKTKLFFSRMFGPTCPNQTTKFSVGLWKQILARMAWFKMSYTNVKM